MDAVLFLDHSKTKLFVQILNVIEIRPIHHPTYFCPFKIRTCFSRIWVSTVVCFLFCNTTKYFCWIFQGNTEQHQLTLIAQLCGALTPEVWPGVEALDLYNKIELPKSAKRRCVLVWLPSLTNFAC